MTIIETHGTKPEGRAERSRRGSWVPVACAVLLAAGLMFGGAALLSLLLFPLMLVLLGSRERALALVTKKTGQLRHQGLHDALTGLPNRTLALARAEQMLTRARRSGTPVAALYVDIDALKHVNDTCGRAAGDQFLKMIAARLRSVVRESDTVARLAGDGFLVLLDTSTLDATPEMVAERVLEVVREPHDPKRSSGRQISLTASIGVAYGLPGTAEELLADADLALYAAKAAGKNCYLVFQSGMQIAAHERLTLEMDLAEALEAEQLFIVYQPIFDLLTERAIGAEALLRWRHPVLGIIPPNVFIPIAEDMGLIAAIGRWVLEQACHQGAKWDAQGHKIGISVNVSVRQLDRDDLIDDVRSALHGAGLEPTALTLEITETTLIRDADATASRLAALKELGVSIAVDDFGTGYSSLAYLSQFSVDSLKIDRSFVNGIDGSAQSTALIRTLVRLGKSLSLKTVAEGIENQAQLTALQREHCDQGQGFLLARPLEVDAIDQFLNKESERTAVMA